MKIWYKLTNGKIKAWTKMEDGYYVFRDIWWFKYGGNKRSSIKRELKNSLCIVSRRINHIPYDLSTNYIYLISINSERLEKIVKEFKTIITKIEKNIMKDLDDL
jgi:hypothetical protein